MLPFVSFHAKSNPPLPAAERERVRERERETARDRERDSPPSILLQFAFQFQGALLAKLCLSKAKAAKKKNTDAFEAKRKQLWHYIIGNSTISTIMISMQIFSIWSYGNCTTKHANTPIQRGGCNGRLITKNYFLRK